MIQVYLTNLGKYNEGCLIGKFIKLPIKEEHFKKALKEIGIDGVEYEEYFITDVESDISGLSEVITEYTSIKTLNELAERLEELSESDADKLSAVLESERKSSITDILDTIDNLDNWSLYADVNDEKELGYYYADELSAISIPDNIKPYFDYEAYGRDLTMSLSCCFTSYGLVVDYSRKNYYF